MSIGANSIDYQFGFTAGYAAAKAVVKHGRWVHKYGDGHEEPAITGGECSICGYVHTATNYCPNCGADMREVGE